MYRFFDAPVTAIDDDDEYDDDQKKDAASENDQQDAPPMQHGVSIDEHCHLSHHAADSTGAATRRCSR